MSKKYRLAILSIILFSIVLYIFPAILVKEFISKRLTDYLLRDNNFEVVISQVDWKWYPVPHILINELTCIKAKEFSIFSKQVELIPSLTSLVYLNLKFDIIINDIEFNLIQLSRKVNSEKKDRQNELSIKNLNWINRITIRNGKIGLISGNISGFEFNNINLENVKLNIDIDFDEIIINASFDTNFSKKNNLNLQYDLFDNEVNFILKTQELNISILSNLLPNEKSLKIKHSKLNGEIKININKKDKTKVYAHFFNSEVSVVKDEKIIKDFLIRNINTLVIIDELNTKVQLNKLYLIKPEIKASGYINVSKESDSIPRWDIDINSEFLDITAFREYIKDIFHDSDQPDRLFKYVHSGVAHNSKFKYNAKTKYPLDSELMFYEGKIENCKIYIPLLDYYIDNLSANVILNNGILKLENIIANEKVNKSSGGSFLISVDEKDFFSLNLDLVMELNTIKKLLYELYHRPKIRQELDRFSNLSGYVKGKLYIGDRLSDLNTNITIDQINVSLKYDRIPWDIIINDGIIRITNKGLILDSVNIKLENNIIEKISGNLSFNDQFNFKFISQKITIHSDTFKSRISQVIDITNTPLRHIDSISGQIFLSDTEMMGNFFIPNTWNYSTTINTKKIILKTGLFFSDIILENSYLLVNNNTIDVKNLQLFSSLDNNKISITGKVKNPISDNNVHSFDLQLNGNLGIHYYNWLKSFKILRDSFYPKFPLQISNLKISKNYTEYSIKGDLKPINSNYQLNINVNANKDLINIESLKLYKKNDLVSTLSFKKNGDDLLFFEFTGRLDKAILDEILMENNLLDGQINGNIKLSLNNLNSKENYCQGEFYINSLTITHNHQKAQILSSIIKGNKNNLELINTNLLFNNESLLINGHLFLNEENKKFLLNIYSDFLSERNIDNFFSNNDKGYLKRLNIEPEVYFNIKNFTLTRNNKINTSSELIINDLEGKYTSNQDRSYIEIQNGNLCGMKLNGTIRRNFLNKSSYFNLIIDKDDPKNFKEFLPCIGFTNTEIEGKFSLNLNITKKNDDFESGHLYLYSDDGKINRFTLLSKVLTLVNVTYILENLPDIFKSGLNYKHFEIDGSISNNVLYLNKSIIKGSGMNLISHGSLNLKTMEVDLVVLVTPLKTLDAILKNIPIVGKVLGGNNGAILTYPVGVKGPLNDPKINTLPPESIGEAITTLLTETLRLPFKIISPILKGDTEKNIKE